MKYENLFEIPHQIHLIIEILQFILVHMILYPKKIISLPTIELIPTENAKQHLFYMTNEKDILYYSQPALWKIEYHMDKEESHYFCSKSFDHQMIHWMKQCKKLSSIRASQCKFHRRLKLLFELIIQEYEKINFPQGYCTECHCRDQEMQELNYPLHMIQKFYKGHRDIQLSVLQNIIKPHIHICEKLFSQTRSSLTQSIIINVIYKVYMKYKSIYSESLLNHQDITPIIRKFKIDIQEKLIKTIPFISFREIDFEAWFQSLFSFQLELITSSPNESQKVFYCKKLLLLLYESFPEEIIPTNDYHIFLKSQWYPFSISFNIYEYHPLLRGNLILHCL